MPTQEVRVSNSLSIISVYTFTLAITASLIFAMSSTHSERIFVYDALLFILSLSVLAGYDCGQLNFENSEW